MLDAPPLASNFWIFSFKNSWFEGSVKLNIDCPKIVSFCSAENPYITANLSDTYWIFPSKDTMPIPSGEADIIASYFLLLCCNASSTSFWTEMSTKLSISFSLPPIRTFLIVFRIANGLLFVRSKTRSELSTSWPLSQTGQQFSCAGHINKWHLLPTISAWLSPINSVANELICSIVRVSGSIITMPTAIFSNNERWRFSFSFSWSSICLRSVISLEMPKVPMMFPSKSRSGIFVVATHVSGRSAQVSLSSFLIGWPVLIILCSSS